MLVKNKPYVKILENGILTNPITKENPFVNLKTHYFQRSSFRIWQRLRNKYFLGKVVLN